LELAKAVFVVVAIGRMLVACDDAIEGIAKGFAQHFSAATGGYLKEDGPGATKVQRYLLLPWSFQPVHKEIVTDGQA